VAADATQISQIVVNLVMNAAEATAPGAPDKNRIVVSARSDGREAVLQVEDTGSGIEPALIGRVFEPFVSTKGSDVQRGFGLAIVKELITSLGGDIKVASEVGKGTSFTVTLPLVDPKT
jgi:signal transduction histidine kinase